MDYSERLNRIYNGVAWHGSTTTDILNDVTAAEAVKRTADGMHNIAELVSHMITWREFTIHMINREYDYRVEINSPVDWPVIDDINATDWKALLSKLESNTNELSQLIAGLTPEQFEEQLGDRPFPLLVVVAGVIDHDVYHCGQIAYVKKFVRREAT